MRRLIVGVLLFLLAGGGLFAGERAFQKPTPRDKCPVCGMFVAKYPDWVAEVLFKDGAYVAFDGAKDLFKYLFSLQKYSPSRKASDIEAVYVTDYYSLDIIDGRAAYYVLGSDVYGPMGRELIPFLREEEAKEFMVDHRGRSIVRFQEVTPDLIKALD